MEIYNKVLTEIKKGLDCVIVTIIEASEQTPGKPSFKMVVTSDGNSFGTVGGGDIEAEAIHYSAEILKNRKSEFKHYNLDELGMGCGGSQSLFYDYIPAKRQLSIYGGGHVGQALYKLATNCSFAVTVYDDRESIREMFPAEDFILCNLDNLGKDNIPNQGCFATIMTYNHTHDYSCMKQLLKPENKLKYIGCIGSRNKIKNSINKLQKEGLDTSNLFAPIGVDIGGITHEEIAVAILAEIIGIANGHKIDSLRNKLV